MSQTPEFIGQVYKDVNTGNIWRSNSIISGDWSLELQNQQIRLQPSNVSVEGLFGISTNYADNNTLTGFEYTGVTIPRLELSYFHTLTYVSLPNLISVDDSENNGGGIYITDNDVLTSISAPNLVTVGGSDFRSGGYCPLLTSISFPELINARYGFYARSATSLTSVSFPKYLPTNGKTVQLDNCALSAVSVNHILARCVANAAYVTGTVDLSGGASSAPTGQGVTDKNTLIARGVVVTTN